MFPSGVITDNQTIRGSSWEVFDISKVGPGRVGPGRVGSRGFEGLTRRVGTGLADPTRPDRTRKFRPDPEQPWPWLLSVCLAADAAHVNMPAPNYFAPWRYMLDIS